MLNYIWFGMIMIAVVVGVCTGRLNETTNAALSSAKEAVTVAISMLGIVSMWAGFMRIAEQSGLVRSLSRRMEPLLSWLFPDIPKKSKAIEYISANFLANILGLGWAATPAGLKAMEEMQKYNTKKDTASRSMCMFLIINMSSLQIVTVSILAYREQYGSRNPAEIIGPGIATTVISSLAAVVFAKIMERRG